jgi:hypothetical protein
MSGNESAERRRPLEDWMAQHLRLTLFPSERFEPKQKDWWEGVTGDLPEKRETLLSQKTFADSGVFQGGQLVNVIAPNRIDWRLSAVEKKDPPVPFEAVGSFPEVLSAFTAKLGTWLEGHAPEARRIALGATVFLRVTSRLEGNNLLAAYLPSLQIDENNADILFRINRRRPSTVLTGWMVNRLCTWSVVEAVVAAMSPRPESEQPIDVRQIGERATACQVEFDVNTDQMYDGTLRSEVLVPVLNELKAMATELVAKGDVI